MMESALNSDLLTELRAAWSARVKALCRECLAIAVADERGILPAEFAPMRNWAWAIVRKRLDPEAFLRHKGREHVLTTMLSENWTLEEQRKLPAGAAPVRPVP